MPSSQTSHAERVEAVIRSACRRRLFVLAVEHSALALALVLAGVVLMLLLGTHILHWAWLVLLAFTGATFAFIRTRKRVLPAYRVAQILDRRLQLSDSLSTACFLISRTNTEMHPVARFQIAGAAALAAQVRASRAFPFTGGRLWTLSTTLAAVAFGLFAVRYLVTSSLSVERALVPLHFPAVFESLDPSGVNQNGRASDRNRSSRQEAQLHFSGQEERSQMRDGREPAGANTEGANGESQTRSSTSKAGIIQRQGELHGGRDTSSTAQKTSGDKTAESAGDQTKSDAERNLKQQSEDGQQGSSGLLDKMKDALSSLMEKMRPSQSAQESAQSGDRTPQDRKAGDAAFAAKNAQGQEDARDQQSSQNQTSEAQAQGQTAEKLQGSQGRNSDQSAEKDSEAHSGIGRQNGDKELKEAEQLRAIGKLAEIIGKRSASVTGEMMVETSSGKQQLKTEYSQRLGHHADLGGEINRDEIPLADQQYIREYMELVRKQGRTPRTERPE